MNEFKVKPTKLHSLLKKVSEVSSISNPIKDYENAIYALGKECYVKLLQGKLLEVKYDGTILNYKEKI